MLDFKQLCYYLGKFLISGQEVFRSPETVVYGEIPSEPTNQSKPTAFDSSIPILKCGKNHSNQVQALTQIHAVNLLSKNQKPLWNDHFVKGSSLETTSNLKMTNKGKRRKKINTNNNSVKSSDANGVGIKCQSNDRDANLHSKQEKLSQ